MCTAPDVDRSSQDFAQRQADEARAEETRRQGLIDYGLHSLGAIFDGGERYATAEGFKAKQGPTIASEGFGGLVDQRREAYLSTQVPELQKRFDDARRQLVYSLARAGRLGSSTAATRDAALGQDFQTADARVRAGANADAAAFRSNINDTRSALESQLRASADPVAAVNSALTRGVQFREDQPTPSALGDIFGAATTGIGQGIANYQLIDTERRLNNLLRAPTGGGSGRVVNPSV